MSDLRKLRNSLAALLAFQLTPKAAGLQLTPKAAGLQLTPKAAGLQLTPKAGALQRRLWCRRLQHSPKAHGRLSEQKGRYRTFGAILTLLGVLQHSPKAAKRGLLILSLFASQKAIAIAGERKSLNRTSGIGFVALVFFQLTPKAHAFDPFTIATGAQAVSGILGGLEKVDELAGAGFAISDLLTELDIDPETDQEIEAQVKRLEELDRQARDMRSAGRDVRSLTAHDLQNNLLRSKNFATRIKRVREMIRTTKRLAAIMGLRPKASEKALKIQDARLQYMILDELMAIRRMQFESSLENKEQRAKYQLALGQVLEEEGKAYRRDLNIRSFNHGSLR
jgi:hypothetical protein